MSSSARSSSSSTTSMGSSAAGFGSAEDSGFYFPSDLITIRDRKDEALADLKTDLMAALQEEVKSLDIDSWKFAGPRSQIHLVSRPGNANSFLMTGLVILPNHV